MDSDILDDFEDDNKDDLLVMEKQKNFEQKSRNEIDESMDNFDDSFDGSLDEKTKKQDIQNLKDNLIKNESIINKSFASDFDQSNDEEDDQEFAKLEKQVTKDFEKKIQEEKKISEEKLEKKVKEEKKIKKKKLRIQKSKSKKELRRKSELKNIVLKSKNVEGVLNMQQLLKENRNLFNNLKNVNKNLSKMIDKKGYENLLNKIKKNKNEFKFRPLGIKIKTHCREIENNEKMIKNLENDYKNYKNYSKKLDSTVILNSINQKIEKKNHLIKIFKKDIYEIKIKNKKIANFLVKESYKPKKKYKLKKLMLDIDSYMGKSYLLKEKILNLEELKLELKNEIKKNHKNMKNIDGELGNLGMNNYDEEIIKKFKMKKKVKNKWKNFINITEHNIEQKIHFYERDCEVLILKKKNLFKKSENQNRILEIQHKQLQDYIKNGHLDNKQISLYDFETKNKKLRASSVKKKNLSYKKRDSSIHNNNKINKIKNIYVSGKKKRPPSQKNKKRLSSKKKRLSSNKKRNSLNKKNTKMSPYKKLKSYKKKSPFLLKRKKSNSKKSVKSKKEMKPKVLFQNKSKTNLNLETPLKKNIINSDSDNLNFDKSKDLKENNKSFEKKTSNKNIQDVNVEKIDFDSNKNEKKVKFEHIKKNDNNNNIPQSKENNFEVEEVKEKKENIVKPNIIEAKQNIIKIKPNIVDVKPNKLKEEDDELDFLFIDNNKKKEIKEIKKDTDLDGLSFLNDDEEDKKNNIKNEKNDNEDDFDFLD